MYMYVFDLGGGCNPYC